MIDVLSTDIFCVIYFQIDDSDPTEEKDFHDDDDGDVRNFVL